MQSVHIAKNRSQPVKHKVVAFMGKIECKKYPKAVWNSMMNEQKMQVRKQCEQQGIKPAMKQTSAEVRIITIETQLSISSQPMESGIKKKEGEIPKQPALGRNKGNPMVTCQALSSKCKEPC